MSTASRPVSRPGKNENKPKQADDKRNRLKLNPPEEYFGQRDKLDSWLIQYKLYFAFKGSEVKTTHKIIYAITYFRGQTGNWIKPKVSVYLEDPSDTDIKIFFKDWEIFKKEIRRVFGIANEDRIAERRIQEIQQIKSAAEYIAEFQRWINRTEWDDIALMYIFKKNLKEDVKDQFMWDGRQHNELDIFYEIAIELDNKLYERRIEKNPKKAYYRPGPGGLFKTRKPQNNYSNQSYDLMELDATKKQSKKKTPKG